MKKNLPDCPVSSTECRFIEEGGMTTLMHSPVVRDADDKPISGGSNIITASVKCLACRNRWIYKETELEREQGKDRVFDRPQSLDRSDR